MKLSMMALAKDRLVCRFDKEIERGMVMEMKMSDGGAGRPDDSGYIFRIPAIAGIGQVCAN